jgi:hypothetical protein
MSSAGGCPSWQAVLSAGTSIVPPGPCPPPADTPDPSVIVTTPQVTASIHDFAGSLGAASATAEQAGIRLLTKSRGVCSQEYGHGEVIDRPVKEPKQAPRPSTDRPQAASSNFSSDIVLGTGSTGLVEDLVDLLDEASGDDLLHDLGGAAEDRRG